MSKVKEKKKYVYYYPENKEIGDKIKGMGGFITKKMLNNKYSWSMVIAVMRGIRNNGEIVAAMKQLVELSKSHNY
jgi:hypothetical protein